MELFLEIFCCCTVQAFLVNRLQEVVEIFPKEEVKPIKVFLLHLVRNFLTRKASGSCCCGSGSSSWTSGKKYQHCPPGKQVRNGGLVQFCKTIFQLQVNHFNFNLET